MQALQISVLVRSRVWRQFDAPAPIRLRYVSSPFEARIRRGERTLGSLFRQRTGVKAVCFLEMLPYPDMKISGNSSEP